MNSYKIAGACIKLIRIVICEDEKVLLNELADKVRTILDEHLFIYSLELYTNGNAVLAREGFDLLLLDIAMEPLNGLEVARRLRRRGDKSTLVFITAHRQYAIEAYDVQASHYLVKPVDVKKLEEVLLKLCSVLQDECKETIAVRQGTGIRKILLGQILYLEVLGRKIHLHTAQEVILFYGKLEELERSLPEFFFRCHRSYIINFRHVQRYDRTDVWLDNGESIPLSKRRYHTFGVMFMRFLKESGAVF